MSGTTTFKSSLFPGTRQFEYTVTVREAAAVQIALRDTETGERWQSQLSDIDLKHTGIWLLNNQVFLCAQIKSWLNSRAETIDRCVDPIQGSPNRKLMVWCRARARIAGGMPTLLLQGELSLAHEKTPAFPSHTQQVQVKTEAATSTTTSSSSPKPATGLDLVPANDELLALSSAANFLNNQRSITTMPGPTGANTVHVAMEFGSGHVKAALWEDGGIAIVPWDSSVRWQGMYFGTNLTPRIHDLYDFQKLIGLSFHDPMVVEGRSRWPFPVVVRDDGAVHVAFYSNKGALLEPTVEKTLQGLMYERAVAAKKLTGKSVASLVVTVPEFMTAAQHHVVRSVAARVLPTPGPVRLLSEVDAARLAYAHQYQLHHQRKSLLILFGATSTHVVLIENRADRIEVVAKRCIPELSTNSVDDRIACYLAAKIQQSQGVDPCVLRSNGVELRATARQFRVNLLLSITTSGIVKGTRISWPVALSRTRLDALLEDLCFTLTRAIHDVLLEGRTLAPKLKHVVATGDWMAIPGLNSVVFNQPRYSGKGEGTGKFVAGGGAIYAALCGRHAQSASGEWSTTVLNTFADIEVDRALSDCR